MGARADPGIRPRGLVDEEHLAVLGQRPAGVVHEQLESVDHLAQPGHGREGQHIRLSAQLGSNLCGVCYILDEPTVGLHMADVGNLVKVVHKLVDGGQTVVMIEHNPDVIAEADWVIDLGPEGGAGGGRVVAQGAPDALAKRPPAKSHTAKFLAEMLG